MEWFKKHVDTAVTLGVIFGGFCWLWGQFNNIDKRFNNLEKDVAIIKTVMIMKNIIPPELAKDSEK